MSKLLMYDFLCRCGQSHEAMVAQDQRVSPCPACGKDAMRTIPAPRPVLDGISGDFPTAADAWIKRRESHMKKEQKMVENHGSYKDMYK